MTAQLPSLIEPAVLADRCREVAARENLQAYLVEKDYYLTRLLSALGQRFGDELLLKGGTLLSKVDLGFLRMSEDADFVIPEAPSRSRGAYIKRLNAVREALTELEASIGVKRRWPDGEISGKGGHRRWDLEYVSEFGAQSLQLEVSRRPVLRKPREVDLSELLGVTAGRCWALDADEARAEKVRAAFTRNAIRDFCDLDRMLSDGLDLRSKPFIELVDRKLAELGAAPFADQELPFRIDDGRLHALDRAVATELRAVLRVDAPPFNLREMLTRFARLWRLTAPA